MEYINTFSIKLHEDGVLELPHVNIRCAEEAATVFRHVLHGACEEYCYLITFNVKGNITGLCEVSHGELASANVHPRDVYKRALANNAAAIMIAHNHPSGDCSPSEDDIIATKKLKEAGEILGVQLIDHIIVSERDCVSLRAMGYIC